MIRYKDQIVGIFALGVFILLVTIVILLGLKQRWFSRDYDYYTVLSTAAGLSPNMNVLYKGFAVGTIRSYKLADQTVHVRFSIYDTYQHLMKQGSLVELQTSPIGLGNQFLLHPGRGGLLLDEDTLIPAFNSHEANELIERGLAETPPVNDSISLLVSRINTVLFNIDNALKGDDSTSLGRSLLNVELALAGISAAAADINGITSALRSQEGGLHQNLERSLNSLAGILANLDKSSSYLTADMPQVSGAIVELRESIRSAEDVLTALSNNPLLKGGIPKRAVPGATGVNHRAVDF
ncbi:MAG: MlaD family protein [Spirochaetaceae bacterium]|nr:MlaD family protein [Spirochaetaceae bacterium]